MRTILRLVYYERTLQLLDVKNAFLYGILNTTVYLSQPLNSLILLILIMSISSESYLWS